MLDDEITRDSSRVSWEDGIYWGFIGIMAGALLSFICLSIWGQ